MSENLRSFPLFREYCNETMSSAQDMHCYIESVQGSFVSDSMYLKYLTSGGSAGAGLHGRLGPVLALARALRLALGPLLLRLGGAHGEANLVGGDVHVVDARLDRLPGLHILVHLAHKAVLQGKPCFQLFPGMLSLKPADRTQDCRRHLADSATCSDIWTEQSSMVWIMSINE